MAFILRKLDHKASFYDEDWLNDDDAQADAFSDLMTKGNQLSVWLIEEDRSNLDRVIAALAAGRDRVAKLDYAMVETSALDALGIQASKADGRSPDEGANQRWHQDLCRLSGTQLVALAVRMRRGLSREPKSKVRALIVESVRSGFVSKDSLKETLLQSLAADLDVVA